MDKLARTMLMQDLYNLLGEPCSHFQLHVCRQWDDAAWGNYAVWLWEYEDETVDVPALLHAANNLEDRNDLTHALTTINGKALADLWAAMIKEWDGTPDWANGDLEFEWSVSVSPRLGDVLENTELLTRWINEIFEPEATDDAPAV